MNNNNNINRNQALQLIDTFENAETPRDLAAFFATIPSAVRRDAIATVMALGPDGNGEGGHIWAAAEYEGRIKLNVAKMKVLFDNMLEDNMEFALCALARYHESGREALALVRDLIEKRDVWPGASIYPPSDLHKQSALHLARGTSIIKYLIGAWANVNARDSRGRTPLHIESTSTPQKIKALIAAGADPNARDVEGRTPLFYYIDKPAEFKALLDAGANPHVKIPNTGDTVLRYILKRIIGLGLNRMPPGVAKVLKILLKQTNARPSDVVGINVENLPENIRKDVIKRGKIGNRRFFTTAKAVSNRFPANISRNILRRAFQ
jgi:hypothetical protein